MPNFKPKSKKKIKMDENSIITLDNKHNEKMKNFKEINTRIIPILRKKRRKLKKKMKKETDLEKKLELQDKISEIKSEIDKLKPKKNEYLLKNSELIFDYFEKKKELIDGNINEYKLDINNYLINYDLCKKCNGELIHVENKGIIICNKCGEQTSFIVQQEKPSYKEPPKEVCFYAYKRINHFREILAQFQAKETTQIPKEVIKNIKLQIKKERITLLNLKNNKAKDILKKLGYNKYYEHIPFIKDKLGIRPPIMSPELEDKLCNLFMDIQKPYSKHCPEDRVNFLNYYYVLYKMCELLEKKEFLPFFPMLKDPIKRIEQDEIWKKICHELNWEFIVTV